MSEKLIYYLMSICKAINEMKATLIHPVALNVDYQQSNTAENI